MKKIAFIAIASVAFLTACNKPFQKADKGIEYKIVGGGSGEAVKPNEFLEFHVAEIYNNGKQDSLLNDTRKNYSPVINKLDSAGMGPYFKIFTGLKKGDSLVLRMSTDTILKQMQSAPPTSFIKKGHYMITTIKVTDIFKDEATAMAAADKRKLEQERMAEEAAKKQIIEDDKMLQDHFKKNNIVATKAPAGTYVVIHQPGTGANIDTSVVVVAKYTGKVVSTNKTFDSNVDPSFGHPYPFTVNMTNDPMLGGRVVKGWTDGLTLLNKGAKATFYIPSSLAYGANGIPEKIGPNENLAFDVEVVDIMDKTRAKDYFNKQMEAFQKQQAAMMDSLRKKNTVDTTK